MTEMTICPKCKKPSYTAAPQEPSPCPYCRFIFSRMASGTEGDENKDSQKGYKIK